MARVEEMLRDKLAAAREQIRRLRTLERDLQASLDYLETCPTCDPKRIVEACSACDLHEEDQPELLAGDVLIFTEALIHGTAAWKAAHERRTLLYKYSPPHSSWAIQPYDVSRYPNASEQQRRLMAPPSRKVQCSGEPLAFWTTFA